MPTTSARTSTERVPGSTTVPTTRTFALNGLPDGDSVPSSSAPGLSTSTTVSGTATRSSIEPTSTTPKTGVAGIDVTNSPALL